MADTKRCPAIEFLPGPLPTQSLSVSISRVLPGCKGWFCLVPHLSRSFAEWPLVYDVAHLKDNTKYLLSIAYIDKIHNTFVANVFCHLPESKVALIQSQNYINISLQRCPSSRYRQQIFLQ